MVASDPCFIVNPASGSIKDPDELCATIRAVFPNAGIRLGTAPGDAERQAAEALSQGWKTIVAAGGDGTLNETLNGVATGLADIRLGLLPLGTGNDFSRVIDVPLDVNAALQIIASGRTRDIDLIRVTSSRTRLLINVSAGGFSGQVDEKLTEEVKAAWGPLSYVRGFVEALSDLSEYQTEIVLDDDERIQLSAYNVVVANGRYVARGVPIAPTAEIDDGLADLVVVRTASAGTLALLTPQMLVGAHLDNDEILFRRARKIVINSEPCMRFNTDGEFVGDEPAIFEVMPRALRMIVGSAAA
ncbi:MAG TPA: diacylglycerol kinase family protein [Chthoniobacteraceae bacterium]|jgi:diacylglycerol kinase (ATP)